MAKKSPLQKVNEIHGSKEKLAKKVLAFLTCPENEEKEHFENRISVMSNIKLLRLLAANETLISKWKTREALVDVITKKHFSGGNADYAKKIATFSTSKLLDLERKKVKAVKK